MGALEQLDRSGILKDIRNEIQPRKILKAIQPNSKIELSAPGA